MPNKPHIIGLHYLCECKILPDKGKGFVVLGRDRDNILAFIGNDRVCLDCFKKRIKSSVFVAPGTYSDIKGDDEQQIYNIIMADEGRYVGRLLEYVRSGAGELSILRNHKVLPIPGCSTCTTQNAK